MDSAATLHQPAGNDTWELHYSDSVVPYVDAAGVVDRIRLWAGTALVAAVDKRRAQAPSLLLVSGLVKVRCVLHPKAPALDVSGRSVI